MSRRLGADARLWMLPLLKAVHTAVWAFFVMCIAAIWVFAFRGELLQAAIATGVVLAEVAALAVSGWRCPLSPIIARYTEDRRVNFDICLPAWLAGGTMPIFGTLYVGGILFAFGRWAFGAF
ncbi:MAG: hypothetical protein SGJ23_12515 [Alphaproteobacteria bacterium]|nr:hypothetical protein [Alphaproteobacteria bacterium]